MRSIWKNEWKRAFLNPGMALALFIGVCLVLWFQYTNVWNQDIVNQDYHGVESLYYHWLGADIFSMQNFVFFMIVPLLATLPAGTSLCEDINNKYYLHFYTRNKKKEYLLVKYGANFVAAGVAVVTPLVLSILLTAMKFPALKPETIWDMEPSMKGIGYTLYFTHPMLYVLLFLLINFVFAGGLASIALLFGFYSEHRIFVSILPFALYYLVYAICRIVPSKDWDSPNWFINAGYSFCRWYEILISLLVFAIVGVWYAKKGKKYE